VVHDPHEVRRHIGFVSHNTSVYERMSPRELITFFGRLHGISSAALCTRLSSLAETLQMQEFMDTPCSRLSTGMRQKVSIARALVHDPLVLIFDEPTLGLDVIVARNLLETIRDLRHAGKTILFSTHVMREVERICDRVAILSQGQIIDCGTLTELRARHGRHDFEELLYGLLLAHRVSPDEVANSGVIPTEGLG